MLQVILKMTALQAGKLCDCGTSAMLLQGVLSLDLSGGELGGGGGITV